MARINIEDSLYQDQRFIDLAMALGGKFQAIGALVCAWSLAQKWYIKTDKMIPISEWEKQRLPREIISVGLAELIGDKVHVCGADKQFKWLQQRSQAGKWDRLESLKNSTNGRSTVVNGSSTSLLSSPSSLLSSPNSLLLTHYSTTSDEGVAKPPRKRGLSKPTWVAYSEAYELRYGVPPVRNTSVNAKLCKFVERVGEEEAPLVAAFFVTHGDSYYTRQGHSVGALLRDAEKLRTEWATGNKTNSATAKLDEKQLHWQQQAERIAKGDL